MPFISFEFALFFCACFFGSWAFVSRTDLRKLVLLASSYGFISYFDWRLAFLIFASASCNFCMGHLIQQVVSGAAKRIYVALAICFNLALLGLFKYFGFFTHALEPILGSYGISRDLSWLTIAVPIGLSFFTLQALSYQIDIYRGKMAAETSFIDFQIFLTFFPKLVAGPLVRPKQFLSQLKTGLSLTREMVTHGFVLIFFGLVKKLVVADTLANQLVDKVFLDPAGYSAGDVIMAIYGLAIQLYCDISAYCDLAIGCALLLGVRISHNFDRPYAASTLIDFWSRWYTSLTRFFVDYIYRGLGGHEDGALCLCRNIILTFLLAAWWHGTSLGFVVFGFYHALLICGELLVVKLKPAPLSFSVGYGGHPMGQFVRRGEKGIRVVGPVLSTLLTFHLVCLGWVFFKSENVGQAGEIIDAVLNADMTFELVTPYLSLLIASVFCLQFLRARLQEHLGAALSRLNAVVLGLVFGLAVLAIQILSATEIKPFIYSGF